MALEEEEEDHPVAEVPLEAGSYNKSRRGNVKKFLYVSIFIASTVAMLIVMHPGFFQF